MGTRDVFVPALLFLLFVHMLFSAAQARDPYKILGVSRSATTNEIKKAFRKMAKEKHPDIKRNDPEAHNNLKDLNWAYEVLSDKKKRAIYDREGESGLRNGEQGGHHGFDVFRSFFGDIFGFGTSEQKWTEVRGGNVNIDLYVTLEEVYKGDFVEILRNKPVKKQVSGTRKCNCRQEMKARAIGPGQFQMVQHEVCDSCPNIKFVNEEVLLEVEVEVGVESDHAYNFRLEGEPHMDGEAGDLNVIIKVESHPVFKRIGNDLYTNVTISLEDALVGFNMKMSHLDGHEVMIERQQTTKPGEVLIIAGEGMPDYEDNSKIGKLFVTFDVEFPTKTFGAEAKQALREIIGQGSFQKARDASFSQR